MADLASIIQQGMGQTTRQIEGIIPGALAMRDQAMATQLAQRGANRAYALAAQDAALRSRQMTTEEARTGLMQSQEKRMQEQADQQTQTWVDSKALPVFGAISYHNDQADIARGELEKIPVGHTSRASAEAKVAAAVTIRNEKIAAIMGSPEIIALLKKSSISDKTLFDKTITDEIWNTMTEDQKESIADAMSIYQDYAASRGQAEQTAGLQAKAAGDIREAQTRGELQAKQDFGVLDEGKSERDTLVPDYAKFFASGTDALATSLDSSYVGISETQAKANHAQYIAPLAAYIPEYEKLSGEALDITSGVTDVLNAALSKGDEEDQAKALKKVWSGLKENMDTAGYEDQLPGVTEYFRSIEALASKAVEGKENELASLKALSSTMGKVMSGVKGRQARLAGRKAQVVTAE